VAQTLVTPLNRESGLWQRQRSTRPAARGNASYGIGLAGPSLFPGDNTMMNDYTCNAMGGSLANSLQQGMHK